MTYAAELAKLSRTPCTLCVLTLDYCARTFGTSPCSAIGRNLVTNGADWTGANGATPPTGWTDIDVSSCYIDSGYLRISGDALLEKGYIQQVAVVSGSWYTLKATAYKFLFGSAPYVIIGTTPGVSDIALLTTSSITPAALTHTFKATTSSVYITIGAPASFPLGGVVWIDDVVLYCCDDKCYNTFRTCRDKANFSRSTKEYRFVSHEAPLPFEDGERPYLKSVRYLPTEIKDSLTVNGRVSLEMADEPDTDIGIDPYVATRTSVQGNFWQKLLARNPNYKGRRVNVYDGFDGLTEAEFIASGPRFVGGIDNIALGRGTVKIEAADLLKSLEKVEIPAKLNVKLATDVTDSAVSITLTGDDVSSMDSPTGYIRVNDEIIYYGAIDTATKILSSCTRARFGTTAAEHSSGDKVQLTQYYAADNPFDTMQQILTDAGIASADVDSTAFDSEKAFTADLNVEAVISEPEKASDLYRELVDLLGCRSWVSEDLQITIARCLPNHPTRTYSELTDEEDIVQDSASVDLNQKSLVTRCAIYWDRDVIGSADDPADYGRLTLAVDTDAESANENDEASEKKIMSRWLRIGVSGATEEQLTNWVAALASRQVWQFRDAQPLLTLDVELKDSGILTGQFARISTDEILDVDGNDLDSAAFQVVRREKKGNRITLKCLKLTPHRICYVAPNTAPDYSAATDDEKEIYGYMTESDGRMEDNADGYYTF